MATWNLQVGTTGMKKPSSKIRAEIARLQEQLRAAETREAERIGRIALKAGLGDIEIDEAELQTAFEEVAARFRRGLGQKSKSATAAFSTREASGQRGEG
jgi:Arc/MetJ-type ribon-helix-helix transcriptional regulator